MMLFALLLSATISFVTSIRADEVPKNCIDGFTAGTDVAIVTVPYGYNQVMSIIGSYKNLTWSGNPADTVRLDGPDNTVGTTRYYELMGIKLVETITFYSKPPAPGPYQEVHTTANTSVPGMDISFYIPYDGTVVSEICGGRASRFNFTAHFCANDAPTVKGLLHQAHTSDAETVGKFLGGEKFTSCAALGSSSPSGAMPSGTAVMPSSMPTPSVPPISNAADGASYRDILRTVLFGLAACMLT